MKQEHSAPTPVLDAHMYRERRRNYFSSFFFPITAKFPDARRGAKPRKFDKTVTMDFARCCTRENCVGHRVHRVSPETLCQIIELMRTGAGVCNGASVIDGRTLRLVQSVCAATTFSASISCGEWKENSVSNGKTVNWYPRGYMMRDERRKEMTFTAQEPDTMDTTFN